MKLLLHACCGPCSLEPTRLLKAAGHDITIYYANSNIHPAEEYEHRLATLLAWAADAGFEVLEGPYDPATWEACAGRIGDAAIAEVEQTRAEIGVEGEREDEPGSPDDAASNRCKTVTDTEKEAFANASTPTAMTITADGCADEVAPDSRSMSVNDTNSEETSLANAPLSASSTSGAAPRAAVLSVDPARREARCRACYRLRLEETARVAAERGFEGIGTTLSVFASAFLGYLLTKQNMIGHKLVYRFIVVTMYFNAGVIPWYINMMNLHLLNNFLVYILPTIVAPYSIILVKTYVESIPSALEDAAQMDGAGYMARFAWVILPVCLPILATITIFSAVGQWNSFQDTLFLMSDKRL